MLHLSSFSAYFMNSPPFSPWSPTVIHHSAARRYTGTLPAAAADPTTSYRIVPTTRAELPEVASFHIGIHLATTVRNPEEMRAQVADLPTDFPDLYDDDVFSRPGSVHLIAREGPTSRIIGCIGLRSPLPSPPAGEKNPSHWYLSYLSVAPECRGRGVGRALLLAVIRHAVRYDRESGAGTSTSIKLLTLRDVYDPAIALYTSAGFLVDREEASEPPFYKLVYMSLGGEALERIARVGN